MGSACCSSDNPNVTDQTQPEASKPERRKNKKRTIKPIERELSFSRSITMETDSDFEINDDYPPTENSNSPSNPQDVDDNSLSSVPYEAPTTESAQKAIISFKNAVKNGNQALVIQIVDEYPSLELLQFEFENGDNALHVAVRNLYYNLILYLLTNGVSPNDPNQRNGDTALHTAVRTRDVKVVALLTKYKADAKITNNKYETPLTIATDNKYHDIIELLSPETQSLVMSHIQTHRKSVDALATDILSAADTIYNHDPHQNYVALKQSAMDDDDNKKKNENDIDPFFKLKRVTTKNVLHEMHNITAGKNKLPTLSAWLEKKQPQMPYNWQRRWVIVKDSHILWSDIQRNINDPKSVKERKKFNNSINLMAITDIKPVIKSKSQRKFVISVGRDGMKNKTRQYLWKCSTKNDRDDWVKGLQEHINHMKSMLMYFETASN